jgi:hypothetical protein
MDRNSGGIEKTMSLEKDERRWAIFINGRWVPKDLNEDDLTHPCSIKKVLWPVCRMGTQGSNSCRLVKVCKAQHK